MNESKGVNATMKKTSRPAENSVTESSGNVFADLGVKDADAYLAKSVLAIHIQRVIEERHLTQEKAGQILGISQPKVSAIVKGRLDGFSAERLFRFLNVLGCDVKISISRPHPQTPGQVIVI
jgi:predicted XRE-type DNA-binding protein